MITSRSIHRPLVTLGIACALLGTAMSGAAAASPTDLRSPDARDAARTSSLAGSISHPKQDLRNSDRRNPATAVQIARAQERYYATQPGGGSYTTQSGGGSYTPGSATPVTHPAAPVSEPAAPVAEPAAPVASGGGTDWLPIGLSGAAALALALGGFAMVVHRTRRHRNVGAAL